MKPLLTAAVAGGTVWLSLAAAGTPAVACAWLSGAAAAASGIAAAAWWSRAHPDASVQLQVAQLMAGAIADQALSLRLRARFWAAYRLLDTASRRAEETGATSVSIRPGRLARPVMPSEVLDVLPDAPAPDPIATPVHDDQ